MSSTGERVVAGRYRLRRQLGQGAMGTVWEAYDEFLHRTVSVKEVLLPPGVPEAQAAELRERTLREARAIAALSHPNVITLHDVARENGEPFVVTEYVLAHSLATLINVLGPLPEQKAAAITDAVAAGLAAAHQAGITHRDVKPGNVLIGVDGQVKLTDFGIARNVSEQTLTSTGIMLGSPAYISPEVAAGREVTPAADLWGLGATLFATIEGRPPYDVDGAVLETVNQVVHGDIPRPSTEGALGEIIAALMVKEPEERITLRELRNRLHPLLPPPSTPLLTDEDLARLKEATDDPQPASNPQPAGNNEDSSPPADKMARRDAPGNGWGLGDARASEIGESDSDSGDAAPAQAPKDDDAPVLAAAPGPLPFDVTVRAPVGRERGSVATALVAFFSVLFFCAAAAGGFALSRYVGGEPIMPPARQTTPSQTTTSVEDDAGALAPRSGNAASTTPAQGGGFQVPVPRDWVEFTEEVTGDDLPNSTRFYYVSPDGTQLLTVERIVDFYPDHEIEEYVDIRTERGPEVVTQEIEEKPANGITPPGVEPREPARELFYRTITSAAELAPGDPNARDVYQGTFARLLPLARDLWVVSMTVLIDREGPSSELFTDIANGFKVTG
ncbi:serine/threonine protein kinase [Actinophytocola algeriensis]|uniref:non-specific serine/threonine protein kinase n=1 Tax=Actinophytocola algeriensis TaxID=1768010 RepID=A0A7W7PYU0_9PSEU|nr:serine/threonine protein kinase [Actinophytocola algeriensis]MBE1477311.1 serine/threonine protein kinase [Actinophytocola algeriensis]